jgi:ABC-type phosphate/phosphonate transport system ATPase subunit
MVTHEPELAAYTKRIITLRDGELVSDEQVTETRNALDDLAQWNNDHVLLADGSSSSEASSSSETSSSSEEAP